jgi:hypothetical protein
VMRRGHGIERAITDRSRRAILGMRNGASARAVRPRPTELGSGRAGSASPSLDALSSRRRALAEGRAADHPCEGPPSSTNYINRPRAA